MTTQELYEALIALDFIEGYAIRDGFIVDWSNKAAIPKSLAEYTALDVTE
jgi:hypothetical protein